MGEETKDLRQKIAQSQRLLHQMTDPVTVEGLKTHLEDLERKLLLELSARLPERSP